MIADPSAGRVEADLRGGGIVSGCESGWWRILEHKFPTLDFVISATEPDGAPSEYGFRAELSNYPGQPPMVRIWDHKSNQSLAGAMRPRGNRRVEISFQQWSSDTVYRPWERLTGPHNNNASAYPHLAWRSDRRLAFIFEDLYGILNSNARAIRARATA
ncbi:MULTISPECIES: DUF7665 family protein [Burkholderia]|uniref:DUF7665 family protein n=1 Tax=Burkholderia TaxID=32008 RepID=UPI000FD68F28|nr:MULTISPECIES: hypothetical protein [Burkholderia]MBR8190550.1 hypothetical protein [Burkholderia vietnamiensis]